MKTENGGMYVMREFQLEVCQQLLGDSACYLLYYVTVTANAGGRIAKLKNRFKTLFPRSATTSTKK